MEAFSARTRLITVLLVGSGLTLAGCSTPAPTKQPPLQFSEASRPPGGDSYPNWPAPPERLEIAVPDVMERNLFRLVSKKKTARGTSGPQKIVLSKPADIYPELPQTITLKLKFAPENDLDSFNTSPRRELAAYRIQKLFLDPEDYVVPFTGMRCIPLTKINAETQREHRATIKGTSCVLGNFSVWLQGVTIPDVLYDSARFVRDPGYAYFMSNLNVLTYLIAHRDSKIANFTISKEPNRPQVFSIDNGESFGSFPYNFFVDNWDVIRVAALRKDSVDRLRKLSRQDLDALGVVMQFDIDSKGLLRPASPGKNLGASKGVRIREDVVQLGLTQAEIDAVWERVRDLIARVDAGEITVF